jgi:RNA polymerase sigma-70 factor (ECF subfamily)
MKHLPRHDLSALPETTLLDRMLACEEAAWREFHRRYDRLVWCCIHKVAVRFTHVLGPEDVNEVYGNFYAQLLANRMHKLRSFQVERGNKLGTWVGMLAIHCTWDYLRAASRQPAGDPLSVVEESPAYEESPFERAARREDCDRVATLVATLSRRDRIFVRLYFVDGHSPEEVAEAMGISVKTVYTKKHKIRSRLERLLNPHAVAA